MQLDSSSEISPAHSACTAQPITRPRPPNHQLRPLIIPPGRGLHLSPKEVASSLCCVSCLFACLHWLALLLLPGRLSHPRMSKAAQTVANTPNHRSRFFRRYPDCFFAGGFCSGRGHMNGLVGECLDSNTVYEIVVTNLAVVSSRIRSCSRTRIR